MVTGTVVTLNGSASADADGDSLTYTWTLTSRPAGSSATLTGGNTVAPTFTADAAGTYVATLTVGDGKATSIAATVTISASVGNAVPVANAGAVQSVVAGALVTLNGSASSDANGDPLTYAWTLTTRPVGSTATLAGATTAAPTFTADVAGTYVASLMVNDGKVNSTAATVTITASVTNAAPVANAGTAQSVVAGSRVTLNGAGSTDANGDPLTYAWTLTSRPTGSTAALTGATTAAPSFTADLAGTYVASLVVNDGKVNSASASVTVTAAVANAAPVASAGTNQNVVAGAVVTLDGTGSTDANGDTLTYAWTLTSRPTGSAAALTGPATARPTFTADRAGTFVASLVVNDGKVGSAPATVTVTAAVANVAPVANAGPAQNVVTGSTVTLTGAGSTDANGDALTYAWTLTSRPAGSTAALSSATALSPTFAADRAGTYVASLVVNDGKVNSTNTSTVTITAQPPMTMSCIEGTGTQCTGTANLRSENGSVLMSSGLAVFGRSTSDLVVPNPTPATATGLSLLPAAGTADIRVTKNGSRAVTAMSLVLNGLDIKWNSSGDRPVIVETFLPTAGRSVLAVNGAVQQVALPPISDTAFYNFGALNVNATQLNYANNRYFPRTDPARCAVTVPPTPCPAIEVLTPIGMLGFGTWNLAPTAPGYSLEPDRARASRLHGDADIHAGEALPANGGPGVPFAGSKGYRSAKLWAYSAANIMAWDSLDTVGNDDWGGTNERNQMRTGFVTFGEVTDPTTIPTSGTATYDGFLYATYAPNGTLDRGDVEAVVTITVDFASRTMQVVVTGPYLTSSGAAVPLLALTANATMGLARESNYATGTASNAGASVGVSTRFFGALIGGAPVELGGTLSLSNATSGATAIGAFIARKR